MAGALKKCHSCFQLLVITVKIELYRLGEQVTPPNDESDSSLGIMLVMRREYAYS